MGRGRACGSEKRRELRRSCAAGEEERETDIVSGESSATGVTGLSYARRMRNGNAMVMLSCLVVGIFCDGDAQTGKRPPSGKMIAFRPEAALSKAKANITTSHHFFISLFLVSAWSSDAELTRNLSLVDLYSFMLCALSC